MGRRLGVSLAAGLPAKTSVTITHSYKPMAGADWYGPAPEDFKGYCIDDATRAALGGLLDRQKQIGKRENTNTSLIAREVAYVLTTGANWAGPIQHFRLEIELPTADDVLATCFAGLRRTGPKLFAAEQADFVPIDDQAVAFFENDHEPQLR